MAGKERIVTTNRCGVGGGAIAGGFFGDDRRRGRRGRIERLQGVKREHGDAHALHWSCRTESR